MQITELDFQQIRENLIEFFSSSDSPYKDWNFKGSSISTLVDILAYNTHLNAVLAHITVNESFLTSAQLRENVVSRALDIGYIPFSVSASKIIVSTLRFTRDINSTDSTAELPTGVTFTATGADGSTVTFRTINSYIGEYDTDSDSFIFSGIEAYAGALREETFAASAQSIERFTLKTDLADIRTLRVFIYPTSPNDNPVEYFRFTDITETNSDSKIFFLNETGSGKFAISFGNGTLGKRVASPAIVKLTYIKSDEENANGARNFSYTSTFPSNAILPPVELTAERSFGGRVTENIESIKRNAIASFTAQNRAVTKEDISLLLRTEFPFINSVRVFGGEEDLENPQYGKCFICVSNPLNKDQKSQILETVKKKSMLTVIPEIIDPVNISIIPFISFRFENGNENTLKNSISTAVSEFSSLMLSKFDASFKQSRFLTFIDSISDNIINSSVDLLLSQKIDIPTNISIQPTVNFRRNLIRDENGFYLTSSSFFIISDSAFRLVDRVDRFSEQPFIRNVVAVSSDRAVPERVVGKINVNSGTITFNALASAVGGELTLFVKPVRKDIIVSGREILNINTLRLQISGSRK